tara:strand:- start:568 stop:888 length:321 start_codon:yes stop_codon:yes gene_type:complete
MSSSPIKFTKSAVNKLIKLQDAAKVPAAALLCIEVEGLNPENELIYEFLYKKELDQDEKIYESNGFPYILTDYAAYLMKDSRVGYADGHFEIDLSPNLDFSHIGEA